MEPTLWDFKRTGTPQNVLVKAGFVQVGNQNGEMTLEEGPNLKRAFGSAAIPPLETLVPAMTDMVVAHAYDKSGFLASGDLRIQAVATLRQAGMSNTGIGSLTQAIETAAGVAQGELAVGQKARR